MPPETADTENVQVVVRCRPMNEKELANRYKSVVEVDDLDGSVTVHNPKGSEEDPPKMFTFDTVFGADSKQLNVYNQTARSIIENVLEGYNGTIFAYGQTGTGKTFTMEGDRSVPELKGIIPNSFAHIFGCIAKSEGDKRFLVRASYLEIYNEEVRDLLGRDQKIRLEVKERPDIGVFVKDLSGFVVHSADELDRIMTLGNKNRAVGATNMNIHSSRSHAIFTITVECCSDGQEHVRVGKLHLVDLAGSERQSKSGATGQRLVEATKINLSLSTLGNVISALVDGKSTHIPYRNSKLTRLLQDSLGGNSKTVMVYIPNETIQSFTRRFHNKQLFRHWRKFANIGPVDFNYDETISTLRYANRAKTIKNKVHINEDPKDTLIKKFQSEIDELKKQLEEGVLGDSDDGSSTEGAEEDGHPKIKVQRKKALSEEKMKQLQEQIEADRKLLTEKKDMVEEERQRIAAELAVKEADLSQARGEHDNLMQKLQGLEKKIIVGGENLLEKAEEQEKLLEESAKELEERRKQEAHLKEALHEKEAERLNIEEQYSSLQEECASKSKKLKKVWQMQLGAKNELKDIRQEHQREMEGLLENIRQLDRELGLNKFIIDAYIPQEYQEIIEEAVQWNEDIGEYQLRCVAYSGNNMRKQAPEADKSKKKEIDEADLSFMYLSYNAETTRIPTRQKSALTRRARTARPKSSRRPNVQSLDFN